MIHFVTATLSEAMPIIDLFNLREYKSNANFKIYHSDNKSLTISGIGKINSAMSVTQTFNEFNCVRNNTWINVGLVGNKSRKIGEIFLVDKVIDSSSSKVYFPFVGFKKIKSTECVTYDKKDLNYNQSLSDMECSGFFYATNKYGIKEFINILKIVSDNKKSSINFENKCEVYNLIDNKKKFILDLCEFTEKVKEGFEQDNLDKIDLQFEKQFQNIRFTFTQKQQMKSLLKLYFSQYRTLRKNIFDPKKNGAYNVKILKEFLKL